MIAPATLPVDAAPPHPAMGGWRKALRHALDMANRHVTLWLAMAAMLGITGTTIALALVAAKRLVPAGIVMPSR